MEFVKNVTGLLTEEFQNIPAVNTHVIELQRYNVIELCNKLGSVE